MAEEMPRKKTAAEIRRLRKMGLFDAGTTYVAVGVSKPPKHKFWDGWVPPEERDDAGE